MSNAPIRCIRHGLRLHETTGESSRLQSGRSWKRLCEVGHSSFSWFAALMSVMADQALFAYVTLFIIKLSLSVSRRGGPKPFLQQIFYSIKGCVYYRALVHFEHLLSVLRALTLKNQNNSVHWKYPDDALQTVQKWSVRRWTLLALNGRHLGYVAEEEESSDRNTSGFVSRV